MMNKRFLANLKKKKKQISRRLNRLFNYKGVWETGQRHKNIKMESNRIDVIREREKEMRGTESRVFVGCFAEREREQKVLAKMR